MVAHTMRLANLYKHPSLGTMYENTRNTTNAEGLRIAIVVSLYHEQITLVMRDAAVEQFITAGGLEENLCVVMVPGAFELTAAVNALAKRNDFDAVVALGCIIAGQTNHDQVIANAVAQGLTMITIQTGVPIAFGVLTCQSLEQAQARAGGDKGNKGAKAMNAAIETIRTIQSLNAQLAGGG